MPSLSKKNGYKVGAWSETNTEDLSLDEISNSQYKELEGQI